MVEVGVLEAKTRLSQLLDAALLGEEVVITRHGKPLVRLTRIAADTPVRLEGAALEAHVRALRERLAGNRPQPSSAEIDADINAMRGRD